MSEKPEISFYCIKCNGFFKVKGDTPIDDVKCPNCGTYKVFLELEFGKETPIYIT